jgi:hypothetical protein
MKSKFFMTTLAVAMLFASCSKENDDNGITTLTVKVEAASSVSSRAIQTPGTTTPLVITSGVIFLINPDGSILNRAVINPTQLMSPGGQTFSGVPSSTRVFIVANPTTAAQNQFENVVNSFADIQAVTTDALSYQPTTYRNVAMSNYNGVPAGITVTNPTSAAVNVIISPVIARLELFGVTGGDYIEEDDTGTPTGNETRITGFDVIGVFVDSYYPNFTYTGGGQGTLVEMNQMQVASPTLDPAWVGIQDKPTPPATAWTATGTPLVAIPETGMVWGYNIPATQLSRLIIAVENIAFEVSPDSGVSWTDATDTNYTGIQYITVGGYNVTIPPATTPVRATDLKRGHIYQIAADGLVFNTSNLHATPNPTAVNLVVNVTIQNWILAQTTTELQ